MSSLQDIQDKLSEEWTSITNKLAERKLDLLEEELKLKKKIKEEDDSKKKLEYEKELLEVRKELKEYKTIDLWGAEDAAKAERKKTITTKLKEEQDLNLAKTEENTKLQENILALENATSEELKLLMEWLKYQENVDVLEKLILAEQEKTSKLKLAKETMEEKISLLKKEKDDAKKLEKDFTKFYELETKARIDILNKYIRRLKKARALWASVSWVWKATTLSSANPTQQQIHNTGSTINTWDLTVIANNPQEFSNELNDLKTVTD